MLGVMRTIIIDKINIKWLIRLKCKVCGEFFYLCNEEGESGVCPQHYSQWLKEQKLRILNSKN